MPVFFYRFLPFSGSSLRFIMRVYTYCLVSLVLLLLVACAEEPAPVNLVVAEQQRIKQVNDTILQQARLQIQTGDLVLRTGTDFSSEQVKAFSKEDQTYSHGGIAVVEKEGVFVYHVEPDYYYVTDKVRKEPLDSFCNPNKNLGIAIARYQMSEDEKKIFIGYLDQQYQDKIPFDMYFMLNSDDSLYCSEMIRKGLLKATQGRIAIEIQPLTDRSKFRLIKRYFKLEEKQFRNRELIPIDRLFINPGCTMIKRYVFLKQ